MVRQHEGNSDLGLFTLPGPESLTRCVAGKFPPSLTIVMPVEEVSTGPVVPNVAGAFALQRDEFPYAADLYLFDYVVGSFEGHRLPPGNRNAFPGDA